MVNDLHRLASLTPHFTGLLDHGNDNLNMFEINISSLNSTSQMVKPYIKKYIFSTPYYSDNLADCRIQLGLTSAPTVQFHPALGGPNKSNKLSVISYDLNRKCV